MPRLITILRALYQTTGLAFVLLAVPLAFDVGGTDCGISFTFLLSLFYIVMCTLRLALRRTFLRYIASLFYYLQFIVIPSMLLLHLSQCPISHPWLTNTIWPWKMGLEYATGVFTIMEGFCVLIVVQACGRASTALIRKSDVFLLVLMVLASLMITTDFYLLLRIYQFPDIVGAATATLIGAALSIFLCLGTYGIWSRRGNVVESTLLFSYIVYQIYLTFTDFQPAFGGGVDRVPSRTLDVNPIGRATTFFWSLFESPEQSPQTHLIEAELPPVIIDGLVQLMAQVAELTPAGIKTMVEFLVAASRSITPSVCISLVVRLSSYFISMRLVPYVNKQTPHQASASGDSSARSSRWLLWAYSYSPVLIIMVYTHLLLQHTGHIVHGSSPTALPLNLHKIWANSRQAWQFWGWVNVFSVLALYAFELPMSPAADGPGTPVAVDDAIEI